MCCILAKRLSELRLGEKWPQPTEKYRGHQLGDRLEVTLQSFVGMFVPIAPFCLRKESRPSLGLHMRGLFRREKSKQASFELSCRKLTVTVSAIRLHELGNRFWHLAELRYRRCRSSAMSMVTSRDQPSAALKAMMRTGLLYRIEAKGRPQYAERPSGIKIYSR